ncbi:MAG: 3'(2'), 5'-bisphosphate nucleotidase [Bacteriovoracaceae bacterium]|jgi:3'(2'), 5'-bisphosphate nucleotidase
MIEKIIEIAEEAGRVVEKVAEKAFKVSIKSDNTPVTEADLASHEYITEALKKLYPEIPILSEESCSIDVKERQAWKKYFLVDPIDGTKEFIKQNGQYAVLISLMEDNRPTLGVIHAPVLKETWYAEKGKGAFKKDPDGSVASIMVTPAPEKKIKVAVSASHLSKKTSEYMEKEFKAFETHPIGSAIKFCRIAEGRVDVYPRLGPTSEWDTAAGEIILEESGGGIVQFDDTSKKLEYNKESLRNPWFIAFGAPLNELN